MINQRGSSDNAEGAKDRLQILTKKSYIFTLYTATQVIIAVVQIRTQQKSSNPNAPHQDDPIHEFGFRSILSLKVGQIDHPGRDERGNDITRTVDGVDMTCQKLIDGVNESGSSSNDSSATARNAPVEKKPAAGRGEGRSSVETVALQAAASRMITRIIVISIHR